MLIALVAIGLLIASVGAIYFLLRSMGQDGVSVGALGSCKSRACGVRNSAGAEAGCHQDEARPGEAGEITKVADLGSDDAVVRQPDHRTTVS